MQNRLTHRLFIVFGSVLAVALIGWSLLPFFVSTDMVRSAIERSINEITGQQVSVGTDADITLFPTATATLTDITIAGRGMDDDAPPIASIETVELDISLGSLLTGKPRFSSVRLIKPTFRIHVDTQSTLIDQLPLNNVRQAVRIARLQRDDERSQNDEQQETTSQRAQINYPDWLEQTVGIVSITDGNIIINAMDNAAVITATSVNGTLTWPRLNMPLEINGSMVVDEQKLDIAYASPQPIDALSGEIAGLDLSITSPIAQMNVDGNVGFASGFFGVGDISFETASVRRFLAWRGRSIQAGRSLGALSLTASMQARGQTIRLNNLQINVDGNAGTGVLELAARDDGPLTLLGTLDFATLDLRSFLSAFTNLPRTTNARGSIDTSFMSQLQTDLRISATTASFDEMMMTSVAATAQTTADLALFDLGDATAFGGTLQARLRFDRNPDAPTIDINLSGQNIDMAAAKQALKLPEILPTGESNFNWTLNAPLVDWSDLLGGARGKMSLRQINGAVTGFGPTILEATNQSQFDQINMETSGAPFQSFILEAPIEDGEIKVRDATIVYDQSAGVTLNGVVQLASRSLALTARIKNDAEPPNQQRYFIGGGWNAPYIFGTLNGPSLPAVE